MQSMSLQCPSCGRHNDNLEQQCECGFINDKSFIPEYEKKSTVVSKSKLIKNIDAPKNGRHSKQIVIKEIDSWAFTFSHEENCVNLGTPALKAFKLKLTLADLEELLESVYRVSGTQKSIRKLHLSAEALSDLIEEINRLIEAKRSKISIKFEKEELQGIAELINKKLEE